MNHVYFECEAYLTNESGRRLSESKRVGIRLYADGNLDMDTPSLGLTVVKGVADRIVYEITPGVMITILFAGLTAPTASSGQTFTISGAKT